MPAELSRRPQTAKQAKAAFKTRGATYVSEAEKKRLERGAELLRRANRIKAQEAKKKEWQDKQAKSGGKQQDVNLSSQRRLDKFGYASSQFHLGKFFKSAPTTGGASIKNETIVEDVEPTEAEQQDEPPTSPIDIDMFLDSSTQIAKDISADETRPVLATTPHKSPVKELNFPSFSSDFDEDTIAQLDGAVEELRRSQSPIKSQTPSVSALQKTQSAFEIDRVKPARMLPPPQPPLRAMAPPMLPPPRPAQALSLSTTISRPRAFQPPERSMAPPPKSFVPAKQSSILPSPNPRPRPVAPDLSKFGISHADLESLAADDIVLSQMPPR
ncbi:Hypothetical protein D9617_9g025160 [Elsinoe fawcettii]|nr:Hypothetical protein D9617_9g025160 [Elsinoe fawcettii]